MLTRKSEDLGRCIQSELASPGLYHSVRQEPAYCDPCLRFKQALLSESQVTHYRFRHVTDVFRLKRQWIL